jgi:hypothetical protein
MFKRLAKIRHFEPRHLVPHRRVPKHSNDNQPGRRRPASQHRLPLTCDWFLVDGTRLECRWNVECFDERRRASCASTGKGSDGRRT